jgi:hypothetical protein
MVVLVISGSSRQILAVRAALSTEMDSIPTLSMPALVSQLQKKAITPTIKEAETAMASIPAIWVRHPSPQRRRAHHARSFHSVITLSPLRLLKVVPLVDVLKPRNAKAGSAAHSAKEVRSISRHGVEVDSRFVIWVSNRWFPSKIMKLTPGIRA